MRKATQVIHGGELRPRPGGAITLPIYQSANYEYSDDALTYIRLNNTPNHQALHAKLAELEGTEAALVTSSGMSAITTTLLATLKCGDHLLAQDYLYGGTYSFITEDLADFGIEHTLVSNEPNTWKRALRPNTKAFYAESLSNPLVQLAPHQQIINFCREHGLTSLVDNTFCSPINFQPHALGYDLVLHSATKYLNGHSDIVAGAVAGDADRIRRILHKLNHFGGTLDPHACFLLHRGLKTLHLRMAQHNRNARELASSLQQHKMVIRVNYPALNPPQDSPMSEYGGVLSFETSVDANQLIKRLKLACEAPSLGGVETLVTRPCTSSHSGLSPEQRKNAGIADGLIRVAVGLEDAADLVADFDQAFKAC
jgi:cystathionine beta-lyase/cystathionine gamma-synthase